MSSVGGGGKDAAGTGSRRSGTLLASLIAKKQRRDRDNESARRLAAAQESFTSDIALLVEAFEGTKEGSLEDTEFFARRVRGVVSGFFAEFEEEMQSEVRHNMCCAYLRDPRTKHEIRSGLLLLYYSGLPYQYE